MSTPNDGGSAFPGYGYNPVAGQMVVIGGMTLRDYFAAKAMQGLVASSDDDMTPSSIARASYIMADAMLAAREAQP